MIRTYGGTMKVLLASAIALVFIGQGPSSSTQIVIHAPVALSERAAEALQPVLDAVSRERQRQVEEPALTDAERLVYMGRLDQIARRAAQAMDVSSLSPEEIRAARTRALGVAALVDRENQAGLLAMAPSDRWFTVEDYGEEASRAAFLIVQHGDEELRRRFVPLLEPLVGTGRIDDANYAMMYDRLAVEEGRLQRYGSQFACKGQESEVAPMEDPDGVDARRAAMGMNSMTENAARFANGNPCQMFNRPAATEP